MMMTEVFLDEVGPVDDLVVEFPLGMSSFTGELRHSGGQLIADGRISTCR